jgi:hypothetical protein
MQTLLTTKDGLLLELAKAAARRVAQYRRLRATAGALPYRHPTRLAVTSRARPGLVSKVIVGLVSRHILAARTVEHLVVLDVLLLAGTGPVRPLSRLENSLTLLKLR